MKRALLVKKEYVSLHPLFEGVFSEKFYGERWWLWNGVSKFFLFFC